MRSDPKVRVDLGARSYNILVAPGLLARAGELVTSVLPATGRLVIITNPKINRLYGAEVAHDLRSTGYDVSTIEVPAGERAKSLTWAGKIYGRLMEIGADRQTGIVALGGGVIGDLAGFISATYMRGVPYIQIPTTLLAQVDSSVGGKTAVNQALAKNIIGAFYQPRLVIIDPLVLNTLPPRELRTGLSEVIKYALIGGEPLLGRVRAMLSLRPAAADLTPVIVDCCRYKAEVVAEDERDVGRRAVLNYGHTIGHAIEAVAGYRKYNHGEAVAIGMMGAAKVAQAKGWLGQPEVLLHQELIGSAGLPLKLTKVAVGDVYKHLKHDKKRAGGSDRLVLLKGLGRPVVAPVEPDLIKKTIAGLSGGGK